MKKLSSTFLIGLIIAIVSSLSFAQSDAPVFITADEVTIELGLFIEVTPGSVPVSLYYHADKGMFYYTWYNPEKDIHILKAYNPKTYENIEYKGVYYEKGYTPSY